MVEEQDNNPAETKPGWWQRWFRSSKSRKQTSPTTASRQHRQALAHTQAAITAAATREAVLKLVGSYRNVSNGWALQDPTIRELCQTMDRELWAHAEARLAELDQAPSG